MAFCSICMNKLEIDTIYGISKFTCTECNRTQEIKGLFREFRPLKIPQTQEKYIPPELPEREALCSRCGHTKANYYQMQTRSADEPMTIFNTCTSCKHVWRE